MILQQAFADDLDRQAIVPGQIRQIVRKSAGINLAGEAPVVFMFIIALQRAGDQVIHTVSRENVEAVHAGQL